MPDHAIPFGRHLGKPLADVPTDYLGWLLGQDNLDPALRAALDAELTARGRGLLPQVQPPPRLACPACAGTRFTFDAAAGDVSCGECGAFCFWVFARGYPPSVRVPGVPGGHDDPPGEDWRYVGLVRFADGDWRPLAQAPTLGRCWDALMHLPYRGSDLLVLPVKE